MYALPLLAAAGAGIKAIGGGSAAMGAMNIASTGTMAGGLVQGVGQMKQADQHQAQNMKMQKISWPTPKSMLLSMEWSRPRSLILRQLLVQVCLSCLYFHPRCRKWKFMFQPPHSIAWTRSRHTMSSLTFAMNLCPFAK